MKSTRALLVFCILAAGASPALAQDSMRFSNLPWGVTKAETQKRLAGAGFTFLKIDEQGDLRFVGSVPLIQEPAVVFAYFTPDDRLVKIQVDIAVPDRRALVVYDVVKGLLRDQYGEPDRDLSHFEPPYDGADVEVSQQLVAIKGGKGHVASAWSGQHPMQGIVLSVTDKLLAELSYETVEWADELARRKGIKGEF